MQPQIGMDTHIYSIVWIGKPTQCRLGLGIVFSNLTNHTRSMHNGQYRGFLFIYLTKTILSI